MRTAFSIVLATAAVAAVLMAQTAPEGLPWPNGVYLRSGGDWVVIPANPLVPFTNASDARWLLGFGQSDATVEMPGPHALVQLGNTRPTFYLRGIPSSYGIYLLRSQQREDYRMIRMPMSRDFRQFTKFRTQDMVELELKNVSGDVITATPRTELKPGEYALVSVFQQNERQIRASFDFGVAR